MSVLQIVMLATLVTLTTVLIAKRANIRMYREVLLALIARLMLTVSVEAQSVHATRVSGASGRLRITSRAWRAPLNHRPQRGVSARQIASATPGTRESTGGSVLHARRARTRP